MVVARGHEALADKLARTQEDLANTKEKLADAQDFLGLIPVNGLVLCILLLALMVTGLFVAWSIERDRRRRAEDRRDDVLTILDHFDGYEAYHHPRAVRRRSNERTTTRLP